MLSPARIARFIRALEMDDDSITGKGVKQDALDALVVVGRKYALYFKECSNSALEKHLKSMFVKGLPSELYDEAVDIIANAIEVDMHDNGTPLSMYRKAEKSLIMKVVCDHECLDHNRLVIDYVFGERRFVSIEKAPKKKRRVSILSKEPWAKGLTEEEQLDELDPI